MAQRYSYVKNDPGAYANPQNSLGYVEANDPAEALSKAKGLASSGVMLESPFMGAMDAAGAGSKETSGYGVDRTKAVSSLERARDKAYDLESMRKKAYKEAERYGADMRQARIDAINAMYAPRIDRQKQENLGQMSRVNALNFRKGIVGSGVDTTATGEQKQVNEAAMQALERERSAAINEAIGMADGIAKERAAQLYEEAQGIATANVAKYQGLYDQAKQALETFGRGGVTLTQLKNSEPDVYKTLKETGGFSDFEIDQLLQEAGQTKYSKTEYNKDLGAMVSYGVDPKTGQPVVYTHKLDLPEGYNKDDVEILKGSGGQFFVYDKRNRKLVQQFGSGSGSTTSGYDVSPYGSGDYSSTPGQADPRISDFGAGRGMGVLPEGAAIADPYSAMPKWSSSEMKKLEAAGLLNAPRPQQSKYLFPQDNTSDDDELLELLGG